MPTAWKKAAAASAARKEAEANRLAVQAKADAKAKQDRVLQHQKDGAALSPEDKKAQRDAAKVAKAALKEAAKKKKT